MANWIQEVKGNDFDSRIDFPSDSSNFSLTLLLKLCFIPANPPGKKTRALMADADGRMVSVLRWNHGEWIRFRTEFRFQVYMAWDLAFLLTPPAKYDGFLWPRAGGTRRKVVSKINIQLVDRPDDAHATITLVRLENPGPMVFRSDDFTLDTGDIMPTISRGFGVTWQQHVVAHEVGHLLGLGHVNQNSAGCRLKARSSVCYGANLSQHQNVMGGGDALDPAKDAKPWCDRVANKHTMTRPEDWRVDFASQDAQTRGQSQPDNAGSMVPVGG